MFQRNDKVLITARLILMLAVVLFTLSSLALGITLAVLINGVYFLFTFVGWFVCWLLWIFARLYLSFLCDIKLIRNKLYGESNEMLETFFKSYKKDAYELEKSDESDESDGIEEFEEADEEYETENEEE